MRRYVTITFLLVACAACAVLGTTHPAAYTIQDARAASVFIGVTLTKEVPTYSMDPDEPPTRTIKTTWLGSGVIVDGRKGLILTNWHVADDRGTITDRDYTVELLDGRKYTGPAVKFIRSDIDHDLALLQIVLPEDAEPLPQVILAPRPAQVMDQITVIGCPHGLKFSVSRGIVSAREREAQILMRYREGRRVGRIFLRKGNIQPGVKEYILDQTDAPINGGNSGGGAFDRFGRLVGLVNSGHSNSDGLGFYVRLEDIKKFRDS